MQFKWWMVPYLIILLGISRYIVINMSDSVNVDYANEIAIFAYQCIGIMYLALYIFLEDFFKRYF